MFSYYSDARRNCGKLLLLAALYGGVMSPATARSTKLNVLFIGNSYTYFNNLPSLTEQMARSTGDTLIFDSNTPGGQTLKGHSADPTSTGKISKGDWNYVVLQDQSQSPALSDAFVTNNVIPYARALDSLVHDKNSCGRTIFYMTWGYPDGDASNCAAFPPVCTYNGMDSMLKKRYTEMAVNNDALLSPVGQVFKELMASAPGINLFDGDRKHPSLAGSYAGAMTFYTILYRKDPAAVTFTSALAPADVAAIKAAVHKVVFSKLTKWYVGKYDPQAMFSTAVAGATVTFSSAASLNGVNYRWDFGDGNTSVLANPVHTYAAPGTYTVKLYVDNCILTDTAGQDVIITGTAVDEHNAAGVLRLYPNPAGSWLYLETVNGSNLADAVITVRDMVGRKVLLQSYDGQPLAIGHLAPGIYLLDVQDVSGRHITRKFVKE